MAVATQVLQGLGRRQRAHSGRHVGRTLPRSPLNGPGGESGVTADAGQSRQAGIGGRVARLAGGSDGGGRRPEQGEPRHVGELVVQVNGSCDLARPHRIEIGGLHPGHRRISEHAGAVVDPPQGRCIVPLELHQQALDLGGVRHVAQVHLDVGAGTAQRVQGGVDLRGRCTAPGEHDALDTVTGEPPSHVQTHGPQASGDPVGARTRHRLGRGLRGLGEPSAVELVGAHGELVFVDVELEGGEQAVQGVARRCGIEVDPEPPQVGQLGDHGVGEPHLRRACQGGDLVVGDRHRAPGHRHPPRLGVRRGCLHPPQSGSQPLLRRRRVQAVAQCEGQQTHHHLGLGLREQGVEGRRVAWVGDHPSRLGRPLAAQRVSRSVGGVDDPQGSRDPVARGGLEDRPVLDPSRDRGPGEGAGTVEGSGTVDPVTLAIEL